ncbi:hypothetical protein EDD15DRAFT_2230271 [Pisolithus albus]|nr:hypothetical protein EDD15DRAFT_2230271 [Pisolithus albus]
MAGIKVKVTYAKKRRRLADHGKIQSSPLEVLKPDHENISREEMVRRMLKRSRGTLRMVKYDNNACPTQQEPTTERVKHPGGRSRDRETVQQSNVGGLECAQPVSSGDMTEITSRLLDSPFRGTAGPYSPSPTKKPRESKWSQSARTVSTALKENDTRRVLRDRIAPAPLVGGHSPAKSIERQRHPSGPSTAYMRSQGIPKRPPTLFVPSSETLHTPSSNAPFVSTLPQFQSTPPFPRADNSRSTNTNELPNVSVPSTTDEVMHICDTGSGIARPTIQDPQQLIHLSANSIFSSSEDVEIGHVKSVAAATGIPDGDGICPPCGDPNPSPAYQNECRDSLNYSVPPARTSKYAFGEYAIPLHDASSPPTSTLQPNSSSTRQGSTRVGKQGSPSSASLKVSRERAQERSSRPTRNRQPPRFTSPRKGCGRDALPDGVTQVTMRDLGGTFPNLDCV